MSSKALLMTVIRLEKMEMTETFRYVCRAAS